MIIKKIAVSDVKNLCYNPSGKIKGKTAILRSLVNSEMRFRMKMYKKYGDNKGSNWKLHTDPDTNLMEWRR